MFFAAQVPELSRGKGRARASHEAGAAVQVPYAYKIFFYAPDLFFQRSEVLGSVLDFQRIEVPGSAHDFPRFEVLGSVRDFRGPEVLG